MREPLKDKKRLIHSEIVELKEHVASYLSDIDWNAWEKNDIKKV